MFCTQCGASSADDARFCVTCGAAIGPNAGTGAPAQAPSATPPSAAPPPPATTSSVPQTFVLNQKLLSMTGDSWIDDANGTHAFEVDGQFLALRRSLILKDTAGNELYEINKSLAHLHKTFEIKRGGTVVATIQRALVAMLGEHFTITAADGSQLQVTGDWMSREFHIQNGGRDVIVASRQFFSLHDAYGIQVAPGFDAALALAIVVGLEQIEQEEGHESSSPLGGMLGGVLGGGLGGILGNRD